MSTTLRLGHKFALPTMFPDPKTHSSPC